MNKKKIKTLLTNLIYSDFSIVNTKINQQISKVTILKNKKVYKSLNLFTLNKNIKQFIKCIIFFSKRRKKKLLLSIYVLNFFFNNLLFSILIEERQESKYLKLALYADLIILKEDYKKESILLIMNYNKPKLSALFQIFSKNTYFIIFITLKSLSKNIYFYQLNNTIDTIKKSVFITVLLKKLK